MSTELTALIEQILKRWADEDITTEQAIEQILLWLRQYEARLQTLETKARQLGKR